MATDLPNTAHTATAPRSATDEAGTFSDNAAAASEPQGPAGKKAGRDDPGKRVVRRNPETDAAGPTPDPSFAGTFSRDAASTAQARDPLAALSREGAARDAPDLGYSILWQYLVDSAKWIARAVYSLLAEVVKTILVMLMVPKVVGWFERITARRRADGDRNGDDGKRDEGA